MLEKLMAEIAAIKEQLEATDKVRSALVIGRAVASVASCCDRCDAVMAPSWSSLSLRPLLLCIANNSI